MISNAVLIRGTVVIGIVVADESLTGFLARTDTLLRILFGILVLDSCGICVGILCGFVWDLCGLRAD